MTMAELDQLVAVHMPQIAPPAAGRGRASVTMLRAHDRYETSSALRIDVPALFYFIRLCPICCKEFNRVGGTRRKYCSDGCKQKAYRERKKNKSH